MKKELGQTVHLSQHCPVVDRRIDETAINSHRQWLLLNSCALHTCFLHSNMPSNMACRSCLVWITSACVLWALLGATVRSTLTSAAATPVVSWECVLMESTVTPVLAWKVHNKIFKCCPTPPSSSFYTILHDDTQTLKFRNCEDSFSDIRDDHLSLEMLINVPFHSFKVKQW